MNNKSTITYRFERKQDDEKKQHISLQQEQSQIVNQKKTEQKSPQEPNSSSSYESKDRWFDPSTLNQYTHDYGAWSSPYDAEIQRLEGIIKRENSKGESVYNEPPDIQHADPIYDPTYSYHDSHTYHPQEEVPLMRIRKRKNPIWSFIFSAGGAVITGIVFGYFVLQMFTGDAVDLANDSSLARYTDETSVTTDEAIDAGQSDQPVQGTIQKVVIPSQSYLMLQHGVFSSEDGANLAMEQLSESGFAAASESGEQHYVFAGLSLNRDDALYLSHALKEADKEVYVKTYSLPAAEKINWPGDGSLLSNYVEQSRELVQILANISLLQLQTEDFSGLEDTTVQSVQTSHQEWMKSATEVENEAGEDVKQLIQDMNRAMNVSVNTFNEYVKNPSEPLLWQIQAGIMDYVILQKQWIEAIRL